MFRTTILASLILWSCVSSSVDDDSGGGATDGLTLQSANAVVRVVMDQTQPWLRIPADSPLAGLPQTCTGALVAPQVVLTARHCTAARSESGFADDLSAADLHVCFGAQVAASLDALRSGTLLQRCVGVREIAVPTPTQGQQGDIALLILSERQTQRTLPMRFGDLTLGEGATHVGFGIDPATGFNTLERKDIGATVLYRFGYSDWTDLVRTHPSPTTCGGDSGGPLRDTEGRVIGVLSRALGGCRIGEPTEWRGERNNEVIYTRVQSYAAWIAEVLSRN